MSNLDTLHFGAQISVQIRMTRKRSRPAFVVSVRRSVVVMKPHFTKKRIVSCFRNVKRTDMVYESQSHLSERR